MYAGTNARMRAMNACMTGGGDGLELLTTSLITDYLFLIILYNYHARSIINQSNRKQKNDRQVVVRHDMYVLEHGRKHHTLHRVIGTYTT